MIMQKALAPQMSWSYLAKTMDTVAGYVVNVADAVQARTPAALFALYGLGFHGSPHRPDAPYLDVLRFDSSELMTFTNAIGGRTAEEAAQRNGPFVERPPFAGHGFTVWGNPAIPLWFLDHCRLPPGTELWRIHASGQEQRLAFYRDVGYGWVGAEGPLRIESWVLPSPVIGPRAQWHDVVWPADLLADGQTVALASAGQPPTGGFAQTPRGYWRREVPLSEIGEYFDIRLTGMWRGAPFRVVNRWDQDSRTLAELFYLGRNADIAESLRLTKLDAGVYEATAPVDELADVHGAQNTPRALADHAPQ